MHNFISSTKKFFSTLFTWGWRDQYEDQKGFDLCVYGMSAEEGFTPNFFRRKFRGFLGLPIYMRRVDPSKLRSIRPTVIITHGHKIGPPRDTIPMLPTFIDVVVDNLRKKK